MLRDVEEYISRVISRHTAASSWFFSSILFSPNRDEVVTPRNLEATQGFGLYLRTSSPLFRTCSQSNRFSISLCRQKPVEFRPTRSEMRSLLPKLTGEDPKTPQQPLARQKGDAVTVACQNCRLKKAKCDAGRPACGPCLVRGLACEYDVEQPGISRYTALKRRHDNLERDYAELLGLYDMLRSRPSNDAFSILYRIRTTGDLGSTLSFIKYSPTVIRSIPR